jgi:hypothetical protein
MIRSLASHAVAALVSVLLLTLLPTVGYALLAALSLATEGNMGGPLNLLLVPAASLVGAVSFTACSGVLTLFAQAARKRRGFGAWLPAALALLVGALLGALAALAKAAPTGRAAVAGALLFGLAFNAYWLPYAGVRSLLGRLLRSPPGT